MPSKEFYDDLRALTEDNPFDNVTNIERGLSHGEFSFIVNLPDRDIRIDVIVTGVPVYPKHHEILLYSNDDTPEAVAQTLVELGALSAISIRRLVDLVTTAVSGGDCESHLGTESSQTASSNEPRTPAYDTSDSDDAAFSLDGEVLESGIQYGAPDSSTLENAGRAWRMRTRIQSDLKFVKKAGFKIGCHGDIFRGQACTLNISCRAAKLGISEEAMQAWSIGGSDYIVLQLCYQTGYRGFQELLFLDRKQLGELLFFRVGKCSRYKPDRDPSMSSMTSQAALGMVVSSRSTTSTNPLKRPRQSTGYPLEELFISRPLDDVLNNRLVPIIKHRLEKNMHWREAEDFYASGQSTMPSYVQASPNAKMTQATDTAYPGRVTSDHIAEMEQHANISLPLVAMQFFLRHFVRCTEFCLVCHRQLDQNFEAIKPYVCSDPLCLYQYMNLGFGPRIENEILYQPYVVDLLISFCYASADGEMLKEGPTGMELMVPNCHPDFSASSSQTSVSGRAIDVSFNQSTSELHFLNESDQLLLKAGEWGVIVVAGAVDFEPPIAMNCQLTNLEDFPKVRLTNCIESSAWQRANMGHFDDVVEARFYRYDRKFDETPLIIQRRLICDILETLPTVLEMQTFLLERPGQDLDLWKGRLSPTGLGLLRWIIASSRACILQVDVMTHSAEKGLRIVQRQDCRLGGVPDWIQFRFAMGAPDKEHRFVRAVKENSRTSSVRDTTLFAWHGSVLSSWHSIIRQGLNFERTANGKTYGNGVYLSSYMDTSLSFCSLPKESNIWPKSELQFELAIALNEIVNCRDKFVSQHPHFVINQLDWIQTRYLLVKSESRPASFAAVSQSNRTQVFGQAASPMAVGPTSWNTSHSYRSARPISLPLNAVPPSRRSVRVTHSQQNRKKWKNKKMKGNASFSSTQTRNSFPTDACESDFTDADDQALFADDEADFVHEKLANFTPEVMAKPSYATRGASIRLGKQLQKMLRLQTSTPLSALGWYIDKSLIDNLYQWIIELHTFDRALPLAHDMLYRSVNSIVLELRFGPQYPKTPPFVRVIRPRFLPAAHYGGGGGHITSGGALCMELLTSSGWIPSLPIEVLFMQVILAISDTDPKPARIDPDSDVRESYSVAEAMQAYARMCRTHGWEVPGDLKDIAEAGGALSAFDG